MRDLIAALVQVFAMICQANGYSALNGPKMELDVPIALVVVVIAWTL